MMTNIDLCPNQPFVYLLLWILHLNGLLTFIVLLILLLNYMRSVYVLCNYMFYIYETYNISLCSLFFIFLTDNF